MCFEFDVLLRTLKVQMNAFGVRTPYTDLELADLLDEYGIESLNQFPDIVSLARNLQFNVELAA